MLDATNINSLSDFNRNSREHIERLKLSGAPEVLTVNGKAEVVVQDAKAYQELLRKAEFADTIKAIRRGMQQHSQGESEPLQKVFDDIAAEVGFSLDQ